MNDKKIKKIQKKINALEREYIKFMDDVIFPVLSESKEKIKKLGYEEIALLIEDENLQYKYCTLTSKLLQAKIKRDYIWCIADSKFPNYLNRDVVTITLLLSGLFSYFFPLSYTMIFAACVYWLLTGVYLSGAIEDEINKARKDLIDKNFKLIQADQIQKEKLFDIIDDIDRRELY